MFNQIIDIQLAEAGGSEPVSLTDMKTHLLVDYTDDDTYITGLIKQARRRIENLTNSSLVSKTATLITDWLMEWPLPYGPVSAITSVNYKASLTDTYALLTADLDYFLHGESFYCTLQGRLSIVYTVGYSTVPDDLILAIKNEVAFRYAHRGDKQDGRRDLTLTGHVIDETGRLIEPYIKLWF